MKQYAAYGILFFVGYAILSWTGSLPYIAQLLRLHHKLPETRYSLTLAPAKCGPYYLYVRGAADDLRHKVFFTSLTPPDEAPRPATIVQEFAYGVSRTTISTNRPSYGGNEALNRNDVRPATFIEAFGDYIGGNFCKPYRPGTLRCWNSNIPWCDPPGS